MKTNNNRTDVSNRKPAVFGYARVSTIGQNLDRQLISLRNAGVDEKNIFTDKKSGKDFDRPAWKMLLRTLRPGDVLIVPSLDRFGRNYDEMTHIWSELVKTRNIHIRVLDMPILDTTVGQGLTAAFIGDLVLRILSYVAETERAQIKERQRQGIAAAKARGVRFGRPSVAPPANFRELLQQVDTHAITVREAVAQSGLSRVSFWRLRKALHPPSQNV